MSEFSNWTQEEGKYYRISNINQMNSRDTIYSLGYEYKDAGYYMLNTKSRQEPDEYTFKSRNSLGINQYAIEYNGNYSYGVSDGIYYTFMTTDYGYKIIDQRSHQYKLFSSKENQILEKSLNIMNDQYLNLYDDYKNLIDYPYYVPQIIIRNATPFYLKGIE
jgi:DNA mismatch repair ATPase MutS